ncbi:MAG: YtxH domain-containing protein [Deltaproteobacteria bacterium]|nr:YtxH domain-containing protein [Deltaproteobacteria bacterium]
MENNRSTFLAFFVGGLIGAGLALLFAPQAGNETRRRIKEGFEDAGDWAKDKYQDTRYRVAEGTGKVKQMVTDKKEDISAAYEAGKEAYYKGRERLSKES